MVSTRTGIGIVWLPGQQRSACSSHSLAETIREAERYALKNVSAYHKRQT